MNLRLTLIALLALPLLAACGQGGGEDRGPANDTAAAPAAAPSPVDGVIEHGLRVLTFDPARPGARYAIYRGDYVKPLVTGQESFTIVIPSLKVDMAVPVPEGERGYFKVPDAGVFPFAIGELTGEIEALEFTHARYREVSAKEAAGLIGALHPFLLDVRTPGEFAGGHIEGAALVPVQQLAGRIGELAAHKNEPVLIYCATGNRSTVAAKMLIDAGFEQVINMRRGISEWGRDGLPVVR
jgi:rhodanese-related sulfurtransferase